MRKESQGKVLIIHSRKLSYLVFASCFFASVYNVVYRFFLHICGILCLCICEKIITCEHDLNWKPVYVGLATPKKKSGLPHSKKFDSHDPENWTGSVQFLDCDSVEPKFAIILCLLMYM
jgi:hypothetical protein